MKFENPKPVKKSHHISLIVGAAALIIGAFCTFRIVSNKNIPVNSKTVRTFKQGIKINDVDVGNLTLKQAYKKVNKNGINQVELKNGDLRFIRTSNNVVTSNEIKHFYNDQNVHNTFLTRKLSDNQEKLNKIKNNQTTFYFLKYKYPFSVSDINIIRYENGHYKTQGIEKVRDKISSLDKYNTLDAKYRVKLPDGSNTLIQNQSYGYAINKQKATNAIVDALLANKKSVNGRNCLLGRGFIQTGTGYNLSNHNLGKNYIAVSIKKQEMWIVKNNKTKLHLTDIVTGTNNNQNKTPKGVWYIGYKQSPSVLRGTNDDGSPYASPVQYWMPFTVDGCGFHDASWRYDWSKTAYLSGGSHGCVNIRPSEIRSVWNLVTPYEPVIVY